MSCFRLVSEHTHIYIYITVYIGRAQKDSFWKWNKEDGFVEGEGWQGEGGCMEEDKEDKELLFQMK